METLEMQIDRITAENQRLREALEQYADEKNWAGCNPTYNSDRCLWVAGRHGYEPAQRALERKGKYEKSA